jgi:hypothetical protein
MTTRIQIKTSQQRWRSLADVLDVSSRCSIGVSEMLRQAAALGCEPSSQNNELMVTLGLRLREASTALLKSAAEFESGRLN